MGLQQVNNEAGQSGPPRKEGREDGGEAHLRDDALAKVEGDLRRTDSFGGCSSDRETG